MVGHSPVFKATRHDGHFVLYWAHHALRAHENPALATAAAIAQQLGLPLLIYQGLGGRHRYNSDRHHRFILEAARDFAAELQGHGQRLLFHLPHDPLAPGPLPNLLRQAALAVSELYPVPPFRQWYARHAAREPDLPFLLVDCSCNLPMTLSTGIENRAFTFRKAHMADLRSRIGRTWTEPASDPTQSPWSSREGGS